MSMVINTNVSSLIATRQLDALSVELTRISSTTKFNGVSVLDTATSTNLARTQVLQQAGMSMLSQANSDSQSVLTLLR